MEAFTASERMGKLLSVHIWLANQLCVVVTGWLLCNGSGMLPDQTFCNAFSTIKSARNGQTGVLRLVVEDSLLLARRFLGQTPDLAGVPGVCQRVPLPGPKIQPSAALHISMPSTSLTNVSY